MRLQILVPVMLCLVAVGCQQMDELLNPKPTTEGSRLSNQLKALPKPVPENVKTVTVYKIENKTRYSHGQAISDGMTDMLITALVKTGHFDVVERAVLDDILTEKNLARAGEAGGDAGDTQLIGAQLIFAGSITELDEKGGFGVNLGVNLKQYSAQVGLDIRIVDAATGRVIDSVDARREVTDTGFGVGALGIGGGVEISNALDLAVRETIDLAVVELVTKFGAQ